MNKIVRHILITILIWKDKRKNQFAGVILFMGKDLSIIIDNIKFNVRAGVIFR